MNLFLLLLLLLCCCCCFSSSSISFSSFSPFRIRQDKSCTFGWALKISDLILPEGAATTITPIIVNYRAIFKAVSACFQPPAVGPRQPYRKVDRSGLAMTAPGVTVGRRVGCMAACALLGYGSSRESWTAQFSRVLFKVVSVRAEKSIRAPPRVS